MESKYFLEKLVISPQHLRLVAPRSRLQARRLEIARPSLPGEAERVSERRAPAIHAGRPLPAEQRPLPRGRLLQRAVPLRGHHRQRFDLRRRAERHADRRFGALSADRRGSQREIVHQTTPRVALRTNRWIRASPGRYHRRNVETVRGRSRSRTWRNSPRRKTSRKTKPICAAARIPAAPRCSTRKLPTRRTVPTVPRGALWTLRK